MTDTRNPPDGPSPAHAPTVPAGATASDAARFPVVGIGASAGGLVAFEAFFSAMPGDADPCMAFVLVQHLAPDHKSILSDLVKRYTRMQVFDVEDGMAVRPNCAYIIPPNRDMAFLNGTLQLLEPAAPRGQRLPIDFFFRSLAQDQHERAICIVLSGTGSDGTLGVRAVKGEGGMVMAQSPESTEYDGMPRSAIATGLVDYVLPPSKMPEELVAYVAHAFGRAPRRISQPVPQADDALKKIFVILRVQAGHDFSHYKQNNVMRRVERRMAIHQIDALDGYVRYLRHDPAEVEALVGDLLIGVTSFFRDPEAFAALEEQLVPRLFAGRAPGAAVRVWVPGCSTGEEAYSLAILLQERIEAQKQSHRVELFATDIDPRAIEHARAGVYPASIRADVSPDRLARFFSLDPGGSTYRINKGIRDLVVFSEQDVIKDPPFSKLDLISCRNLLIYLDGDLQQKIIPLFHYALAPNGLLVLGTSETVAECTDLFVTLHRQWKFYQRRDDAFGGRRPAVASNLPPRAASGAGPRFPARARADAKDQLRELAEGVLLQHFSAGAALVDEHGDILYLHGRTGQWLELAPGETSTNILKMARAGLRRELATALHSAAAHREAASRPGLRVETDLDSAIVDLTVRPVATSDEVGASRRLFLVVFEHAEALDQGRAAAASGGGDAGDRAGDTDARIAALTRELRAQEEHLRSANEELETSHEELRSSTEEMQSVNEELQSANEELETSKEELQSVNEELTTVNAELQTKVADLSRANSDMTNLLAGTGIGTVFVDHHLRVQRFTPAVTQVINLIQTDIGRPVGHIVSNLVGYNRLPEDIQAVLDTLVPREIEVQTKAGAWYLLHLRPYRTLDNVIEGAVITLVDVTEMKQAREAVRSAEAERRLAVVVRDACDAILALALDGRILAWNPGAERVYGWSEAEALGMNIRDLVPERQRDEVVATLRHQGQAGTNHHSRAERLAKDGRVLEVFVTATALVNESGIVYAIATTERPAGD